MECSELNKSSGLGKAPKTENGKTHAYRSMNLQERFQVDANMSYADFHHEITEAVEDEPTYPLEEDKQNARIRRNSTEDDELVKYMSKLPAYLERGKNVQEKAFSVGVLDWRRLEKWQHSHKQTVPRNSRYSTSSSSTSSSFSVEGSSSHSSRGRSCSPVHQRIPRSTLQSQLPSSPKDMDVQLVRPSRENLSKCKDLKDVHENHHRLAQHEVNGTVQIPLGEKMEDKKGRLDAEPLQKAETLPCFRSAEVGSCSTEKAEVTECDFIKRLEKTEESNSGVFEPELTGRPSRVVLLVPKDVPNCANPEVSKLAKSRTHSDKKLSEVSRRGILERSRETCHARIHSDMENSCTRTLPLEFDCNNQLKKRPSSMDAGSSKFPSNVSRQPDRSAGVSCTSRVGNSDKKIPSIVPMVSDAVRGSEPKAGNVTTEKVRSTSPFRRLSIGMGKIVKNSRSKEDLTSGKSDAKHASAKFVPENAESSACPDNPRSDKSNSAGRSRSSPLRRLLDPILKPKSSIIHHCNDPLQEHSVSKDKLCTSSNSQSDSLTGQPAKLKLDLSSCKTIDVRDSHLNKRQGSSSVQALLRVAYKNGLPLFSFAVDNDSDILAATMKECSSPQTDKSSWMYTFFTIREARKKSGIWISQGNRGKGQGYIPNAVAQMKVSEFCFSKSKSGISTDQHGSLEYLLLAVDSRPQDQQTADFQLKDELAAIVAQIPLPKKKNSAQDGPENNTPDGLSELESIGSFKNRPCNSSNGENPEDRNPLVNEAPSSATVILPSGVHSLPSKGGPSSLIERWKSGGSCDCGGWDMGCELKILGTHGHFCKNSSSSNSSDQFALFSQSQVDTQENQPVFILAPFKDNIFSVEFSSSLSVLQAFSICIAVLDSRKLIERSETHNAAEEQPLGRTTSTCEGGARPPNHVVQDASAKYVAYPPLSPVGRV